MIRDLDTNSAIVSRSRFARGGRSRQCPPRDPRRLKRRNPSGSHAPWSIRAVPRPDVFTRSPPRPRPPRPVPGVRPTPAARENGAGPVETELRANKFSPRARAPPRPRPRTPTSVRALARGSVGPASAVLLIYSSTIHAPIVRLSYSNVQKECDGADARASRLKGRRELSAPVDRGHYRCTPPVYASRSHRNPRR